MIHFSVLCDHCHFERVLMKQPMRPTDTSVSFDIGLALEPPWLAIPTLGTFCSLQCLADFTASLVALRVPDATP